MHPGTPETMVLGICFTDVAPIFNYDIEIFPTRRNKSFINPCINPGYGEFTG